MNWISQIYTANRLIHAGVGLTGLSMVTTIGTRAWINQHGGKNAHATADSRLFSFSLIGVCAGSVIATAGLILEYNPQKIANIEWIGIRGSSNVFRITPFGSATIQQVERRMFLFQVLPYAVPLPTIGVLATTWAAISGNASAELVGLLASFLGSGFAIFTTGGVVVTDLYFATASISRVLGFLSGTVGGIGWGWLGYRYYNSLREKA